MNKLFAFIAVLGLLNTTTSATMIAQDVASKVRAAQVDVQVASDTQPPSSYKQQEPTSVQAEKKQSIHSALKQKFIEGGPGFMASILICLILGLAIVIEKVVYLYFASTNNQKLLEEIEGALNAGGIEAAKEICRKRRGPVASIFYHGLDQAHEGLAVVEKTIVAYGSVQTNLLEKGLVWIALFIALAPMLGFLGTVMGIVQAFDVIEVSSDISPLLIARGIKVALVTTMGGLIVALILQLFYNYSVSKIDNIVNSMEDASVKLIDLLVKYHVKK